MLWRDVRKVLALPEVVGKDILGQWVFLDDTLLLVCAPEKVGIFGRGSFKQNTDCIHPAYGSEHGIYQPGRGIANVFRPRRKHVPGPDGERLHDPGGRLEHDPYSLLPLARQETEFNTIDLFSKGHSVPDPVEVRRDGAR